MRRSIGIADNFPVAFTAKPRRFCGKGANAVQKFLQRGRNIFTGNRCIAHIRCIQRQHFLGIFFTGRAYYKMAHYSHSLLTKIETVDDSCFIIVPSKRHTVNVRVNFKITSFGIVYFLFPVIDCPTLTHLTTHLVCPPVLQVNSVKSHGSFDVFVTISSTCVGAKVSIVSTRYFHVTPSISKNCTFVPGSNQRISPK